MTKHEAVVVYQHFSLYEAKRGATGACPWFTPNKKSSDLVFSFSTVLYFPTTTLDQTSANRGLDETMMMMVVVMMMLGDILNVD